MIRGKTNKQKNVPGIQIKPGESTTIKTNYQQPGKKGKKNKKIPTPIAIYYTYTYALPQPNYCRPKLICTNCGKKLSSMGAYCSDNKKYQMATKFYCRTCLVERFGRPK
ncbi:hypothetical protein G9A89_003472 [Geosiphon pyriformis]|nr:hypothetical protein G9A89_003472 [Geosiphon pyriformis]